MQKVVYPVVHQKRSEGWSFSKIGCLLGLSRGTVHWMDKKNRCNDTPKQKDIMGRPRKTDTATERLLVRHAKKHPFATIRELQLTVFGTDSTQWLSKQTISRILGRSGLRSCQLRRKPVMNDRVRIARRRYAKMYQQKDWSRVVFSDEKRFRLRSDRPCRVWGSMDS
jgi:hypothetical protein